MKLLKNFLQKIKDFFDFSTFHTYSKHLFSLEIKLLIALVILFVPSNKLRQTIFYTGIRFKIKFSHRLNFIYIYKRR